MPTTADPLADLLNQLEAIVLAQPDKRQQSLKLAEIGAAAGTPATPANSQYTRAQEWLIQRVKAPREQLKLMQWLNRQLLTMTAPQAKAYKKRLREVTKSRTQ